MTRMPESDFLNIQDSAHDNDEQNLQFKIFQHTHPVLRENAAWLTGIIMNALPEQIKRES